MEFNGKTDLEAEAEPGVFVRIDFMGSALNVPVQHANHVVAQFAGDEFFVSFFSLPPPVIVGEMEERKEQLGDMKTIEPQCIARLIMTENVVRQFVDVLSGNLKKYDAKKGN